MAWSRATLVKAITATTGTNNYTLQDPAGAGPYRTDVQANADGSLPTGATVHYLCRDVTVTGDASFERGYGVYTFATRTVARTAGNVLDGSSGPGALVPWGLSGQRDFYILEALDGSEIPSPSEFATTLGLARLAAINTFLTSQVISRTGAAAFLDLQSNLQAGMLAALQFKGHNAAAALTPFARIYSDPTDGAAGSEDGRLWLSTMRNGTLTDAVYVESDGSFKTAGGAKYDAFPTGTPLLFRAAPPTGWTRANETNQAIIRLATAADTPGSSGGSDSFFDGAWATAGHTLAESEIPSHTHTQTVDNGIGGGSSVRPTRTVTSNGAINDGATTATGGGGSHAHAMNVPYYRIACWATKD